MQLARMLNVVSVIMFILLVELHENLDVNLNTYLFGC